MAADTTTADTVADEERRSGELHYKGQVDPPVGSLMGPDAKGRVWQVTGSVYDPVTDKTTVHFDLLQPVLPA